MNEDLYERVIYGGESVFEARSSMMDADKEAVKSTVDTAVFMLGSTGLTRAAIGAVGTLKRMASWRPSRFMSGRKLLPDSRAEQKLLTDSRAKASKGVDLGLRSPASRHRLTGVSQKTVAKNVNTVVEPGVNTAGDIAAINRGEAVRIGDTFEINARVYGSHDGTLYPISGEGFHQLNRGAFKALGVFNKFGDTPQAHEILRRMHNVGPAEIDAAMTAWQ